MERTVAAYPGLDSNPATVHPPQTLLPSASCSTQLSSGTPIPEATRFCKCLLRPDSKRMPRKIRYARPDACQGAPSAARPVCTAQPRRNLGKTGTWQGYDPMLIKPLQVAYSILTAGDFCLNHTAFCSRRALPRPACIDQRDGRHTHAELPYGHTLLHSNGSGRGIHVLGAVGLLERRETPLAAFSSPSSAARNSPPRQPVCP